MGSAGDLSNRMREFISQLLIYVPALLAIFATAVFWRSVERRGLFFVAALLALLGLQALAAPFAVNYWFGMAQMHRVPAEDALFRGLVTSAGFQLALGMPFLWWLRQGLRRK